MDSSFFFAKYASSFMKGGEYFMTYKQIEASREARLWIKDILVPLASIAGLMLLNENIRKGIADKWNDLKFKLKKQPEIVVVDDD